MKRKFRGSERLWLTTTGWLAGSHHGMVIASVSRYREGQLLDLEEGSAALADCAEALQWARDAVESDPSSFTWIRVLEPRVEEIAALGEQLGLSPLEVEDCLNPRQRPKVEIGDGQVFMVLEELRLGDQPEDVETGQISVFTGPGWALTVRFGEATPHSMRRALHNRSGLLACGSDSVLCVAYDIMVRGYQSITDDLDEWITKAEEDVFAGVSTADRIYRLKRENLEVKRAVSPLVTITRRRGELLGALAPALRKDVEDTTDHLLQVIDSVDTNDQLLSTLLASTISQQDLRQGKDQRKIAAWAAIIAVPTLIAGIYGMNFDDMPELHERFGYPVVLAVMVSLCSLLYWRFRRSGWL